MTKVAAVPTSKRTAGVVLGYSIPTDPLNISTATTVNMLMTTLTSLSILITTRLVGQSLKRA